MPKQQHHQQRLHYQLPKRGHLVQARDNITAEQEVPKSLCNQSPLSGFMQLRYEFSCQHHGYQKEGKVCDCKGHLLTHVLCKPTHFVFQLFIATKSNSLQTSFNRVMKDWPDKYNVWGTLQGQMRDNSYIISVVYIYVESYLV